MLETGILNRELAAEMSKMGHTDKMMIVDAGLAVPNTTKVIDLSLSVNVPTVIDVLEEVLKHFSVEKIIYSQATAEVSPSREKEFLDHFDKNVAVEIVPHPVLRDEITRDVKFVIRTGDFTANSNIVLVSAGGPRWYCEKE
jgi:D-ribose pyranase